MDQELMPKGEDFERTLSTSTVVNSSKRWPAACFSGRFFPSPLLHGLGGFAAWNRRGRLAEDFPELQVGHPFGAVEVLDAARTLQFRHPIAAYIEDAAAVAQVELQRE